MWEIVTVKYDGEAGVMLVQLVLVAAKLTVRGMYICEMLGLVNFVSICSQYPQCFLCSYIQ